MKSYLIKGAYVINESKMSSVDVLIKEGRIHSIGEGLEDSSAIEVDASGLTLIPGVIDDQVHFREPGLTHKAELFTESRAAVRGGVTSFMDMPNVKPASLTQELLEERYVLAANKSLANYSFYMGAGNDNLEEVLKTDPTTVCGIKAFMGSSTGNMLVDDPVTLDRLFAEVPMLIATHCEDEETVRANTAEYKEKFGDHIPVKFHPYIRNVKACLTSSSFAIELAKKHNTRLHILHITTADELALFSPGGDLRNKRITSEVCVHHLWFSSDQYETLGTKIKCNPAIKASHHKEALLEGLLDDRLDIIATDHAPHTLEEKDKPYTKAPSGLPLVQHSLPLMLEFYHDNKLSLEFIVEKMCHAPADCFQIKERGYIREGYWADLVLVDLAEKDTVSKSNIAYKCGWSPLEGQEFRSKVVGTWVSGHRAYWDGQLDETQMGERLLFDRT